MTTPPAPIRIPVSRPYLSAREATEVAEAVSSNQLSMGPRVAAFEAAWREVTGCAHAIACNNGTTALHLALAAAKLGPGDRVAVPALTYVATANAVTFTGATPVLVDVDPATWGLSPATIEAAQDAHPFAAVVPVHLYGVPADVDGLWDFGIARHADFLIIEDAAEAAGSRVGGFAAGRVGDAGIFSFYGNKTITTGEGGMLVTDDDEIAATARLLRGQGMDPTRRYFHSVIGFNYRMTELQGAIGVGQMADFVGHVSRRLAVVKLYRQLLGTSHGITWQTPLPADLAAYWMAVPMFRTPSQCVAVAAALAAQGIETRPAFPPLSSFPMYQVDRAHERFPVSYAVAARALVLPTFETLPRASVEEICAIVLRAVESTC